MVEALGGKTVQVTVRAGEEAKVAVEAGQSVEGVNCF
jgi:hypothetical protein